jgi:hypothetical protein
LRFKKLFIDKIEYKISKKIENLNNEQKQIIKNIVKQVIEDLKNEKIIIRKKDRELILKCQKSEAILTIILTRYENSTIIQLEIDKELEPEKFCKNKD